MRTSFWHTAAALVPLLYLSSTASGVDLGTPAAPAAPQVAPAQSIESPAAEKASPSGGPAFLQTDTSPEHVEKREHQTAEDLFSGRPVQRLRLREAIELALHNNLDARFERLGIDIQRAQTKLSASAFDPVLGFTGTYQKVQRPQDINNPSTTSQILQQQGLQTQLNQAALQLNAAQINAFNNQQNLQLEQTQLNRELILQGQSPTTLNSVGANQVLTIQPITNPVLNNIVVLDQEGANLVTSFTGRTAIGTRYALAATVNESRNTFTGDLNPVRTLWDDNLELQVQQPLLKGFGTDSNLADLRVSRLSTRVQTLQWKNNVQNAVQGVMAAYYDMTASLDTMRVLEDAITADSKLVRLYQRRVDLGFGSPFDIQQAAVQVATDRESLLIAKNNFLERQFALKRLVLAKFEAADPRLFFPEATSNLPPPALDRAAFLRTAFENRYDYRGGILNTEAQNIRLRYAKNQLLPELDLVGTYGLNGLGSTFGHGVSDTFSLDHPQWNAGLQFQYPLGNRQARAQFEAALAQKEQSILRLKQVELTVGLDVDTAISRIETFRQRLEAARQTRELGDEAVRIALRRLEEGQISAYDITEQQRRVYDARTRELSAQAELNKAVTILWLATGTVLPKVGIVFTDPDDGGGSGKGPPRPRALPGVVGAPGRAGEASVKAAAPSVPLASAPAARSTAATAPVAPPAPIAAAATATPPPPGASHRVPGITRPVPAFGAAARR